MAYEMRAEYDAEDGAIRHWHMVEDGGVRALCGRDLDPGAPTQSADAWGSEAAEPFCHSCGALYLRQVP
ncbi:hypothetical protein [Streptomyces sp. NPDC001380]|uniref:hypothetical protein n=1 Tax=Streptomyces sp. NPDC001380 TaxID=3364566 RepID=UPI003674DD5B